jgi:hypothetical protein
MPIRSSRRPGYFQAGKLYDPDPPLPTPARYDAIDTYHGISGRS